LLDLRVVLGWLFRVLAFAGGVAALYAGILLYPDEYGHVQNELEEWWKTAYRRQQLELSKAALFMRATATLTGWLLDAVFGKKLISFTSIIVSLSLSMASLIALGDLIYRLPRFAFDVFLPWFLLLVLFGVLSKRFLWARVFAVGILLH
jgi:hypothetical protein